MRRILLLISSIALLLVSSYSLKAQNTPIKLWDKTIGGNNIDELTRHRQTSDGGYILCGSSESGISSDKSQALRGLTDYWVVKLDSNRNKQWDKTLGGNNYDFATDIIQTLDGGYLVGGYSASDPSMDKSEIHMGGGDYWVVKLDASGNKQWDQTVGGSKSDGLTCLLQTSDGSYILGGSSNSEISGDKSEPQKGGINTNDFWIVKLDSVGNKLWDKSFGGNGAENLFCLQITNDGGLILAGSSSSGISGDKSQGGKGDLDYWIIKLDLNGNKDWDKTFGGWETDKLYSLVQTDDGGYLLGGDSNSGMNGDKSEPNKGGVTNTASDYWVIKLDGNGNKQWDRTLGGYSIDRLRSMIQTFDGGYILGGTSFSGIAGDKTEPTMGGYDYWIIKLNASGNKQWDKTYGGNGGDDLYSLAQTNEGGFILAGTSGSPISGDKTEQYKGYNDYWIVKLNPTCADLTVTLTASCSNNTVVNVTVKGLQPVATGSLSYSLTYKVNGITQTLNSSSPTYTLSQNAALNTVFSLIGITSGSCTSNLRDSLIVQTIPAAPNVTPASRCGIGSVSLSATGVPLGGKYSWYNLASGGKSIHKSSTNTFSTPSLNTTTTYYVAAINSGGCEGPRTPVTATVYPTPIMSGGINDTVCANGTPFQLNGFSPVGGIWSGPGVTATGIFMPNYNLIGNQTLTYTITQNGCNFSATKNIIVKQLPWITTGGNQTICAIASPFQLNGFSPAGGTWSGAGVSPIGLFSPNNNLIGKQTLTYSVTQNGCTASAIKEINIIAQPTQPIINLIAIDTLISSVSGLSYQWKRNGITLPVTTQKIKATSNGLYSVQVRDPNNCNSAFSADYNFIISGVKESISDQFRLYPNPNNGEINLELSNKQPVRILIFNPLGQCVLTENVLKTGEQDHIQLDLTKQAKGIYTVQIIMGNQCVTKKVVLQ